VRATKITEPEMSQMPIDDLGVGELARQGATAGLMGLLGRLIALASSARRPNGWALLWEIPMAIGLGVVGKGVADGLHLEGFPHYAVVIAVAYSGPRYLDLILARWAETKGK
jgi:hypothetical protein